MQWKTKLTGKVRANAAMPAMETSVTTLVHSLKINPDLPDSLFVFTPPEGAKENANLFPNMPRGQQRNKAPKTAARPALKQAAPGEPEAYVPELEPTHKVEAKDPPEVASQKVQGFVRVLITIDSKGAVTAAEALSGPEALRPAAIGAIKQWTFHPVIRNERPVAAYTDTTLSFPVHGDFIAPEGASFDAATAADPETLKKFGFDVNAEMRAQQRIEELEQKFPRSPEQVLADTQEQKRGLMGPARTAALHDLAQQAFDAGDLSQASSYARELLEKRSEFQVSGAWIYDANTVLGRVALRQGSITQARQYLIESCKAPAPDYDATPDFTLAHELLEKGDRDGVVEFLGACKAYWTAGAQQLDQMISSVRAGKSF